MKSKVVTFCLLLVFCNIQSSIALKCYNCESISNPKCADLTDADVGLMRQQECIVESLLTVDLGFFSRLGLGGSNVNKGPLLPICVKVVARNDTGRYVARRCAVRFEHEDPCLLAEKASPKTGFHAEFEFCGTCESDGCNGGNSLQLFTALIVFGMMTCTARFLEF